MANEIFDNCTLSEDELIAIGTPAIDVITVGAIGKGGKNADVLAVLIRLLASFMSSQFGKNPADTAKLDLLTAQTLLATAEGIRAANAKPAGNA